MGLSSPTPRVLLGTFELAGISQIEAHRLTWAVSIAQKSELEVKEQSGRGIHGYMQPFLTETPQNGEHSLVDVVDSKGNDVRLQLNLWAVRRSSWPELQSHGYVIVAKIGCLHDVRTGGVGGVGATGWPVLQL